MTNQFTCALCAETFDKGRSDEEAMDEAHAAGRVVEGEMEVVCDDCFSILGDQQPLDFLEPGVAVMVRFYERPYLRRGRLERNGGVMMFREAATGNLYEAEVNTAYTLTEK